eukprot:gnl/TRDRNA2_/TRDRNA2_90239_c0_seq1.p1 gnl/TRDRNA2_/TRDRNA2_90239_c0~~gnl/TRDRNA2_/TRDRNA2_90239_c0_seq1.p1  ORF type:complete len:218 (+),score=36.40 gnl/TRDRNA2_/TRDRNA2_90239_c0_seq1:92-655(+)
MVAKASSQASQCVAMTEAEKHKKNIFRPLFNTSSGWWAPFWKFLRFILTPVRKSLEILQRKVSANVSVSLKTEREGVMIVLLKKLIKKIPFLQKIFNIQGTNATLDGRPIGYEPPSPSSRSFFNPYRSSDTPYVKFKGHVNLPPVLPMAGAHSGEVSFQYPKPKQSLEGSSTSPFQYGDETKPNEPK